MKRFAIFLLAVGLSVSACGAQDAQTAVAAPATPPASEAPGSTSEPAEAPPAAAKPDVPAPTRVAAAPTRTAGDAPSANNPERVARGDKIFKAGRDYTLLTPAQRTSSPPEKVEVAEVFMYQCSHCFTFEPFLDEYLKEQPAEVNFVRIPALFNPIAELHGKAFYASRSLGVWEDLHTAFFREIHTRKNLMRTKDKLLDFIASQGIDRDAFDKALSSFEVDAKFRDARDLNRRYRIDSVPTVVINGKYVTSGSMAKSNDKLREIIDYLVSKESAEL